MRHPTRPQTRRVLLLAAIVLALVAVVALPASASANSTSLTLVASPAITPFGGTAVLTGTLMDTSGVPVALGGQPVYVWSSATGTFPGTLLAIITTGSGTPAYDTGTYTFTVTPANKTFYQMTFLGGGIYDASSSAAVAVTPKVYLSSRACRRRPSSVSGSRSSATCSRATRRRQVLRQGQGLPVPGGQIGDEEGGLGQGRRLPHDDKVHGEPDAEMARLLAHPGLRARRQQARRHHLSLEQDVQGAVGERPARRATGRY